MKQANTNMRVDSFDGFLYKEETSLSLIPKGKLQGLETSIKQREEMFAISDPDSAK